MADGRHLENRIIAMSYDDAEWISMECLGRPPSLILKTNFLTAGALARIRLTRRSGVSGTTFMDVTDVLCFERR